MIFILSIRQVFQKSARKMVDLYLEETAKYGIDNVALLSTPSGRKTDTCVNALNELFTRKNQPAG